MEGPTNPLVGALLTDMYQISMTYAYWKNDKANDNVNLLSRFLRLFET